MFLELLRVFPIGNCPFPLGRKNPCLTLSDLGNFRSEISDELFSTRILAEMEAKSARIFIGNCLSLIAPHNIVLLFKEKSERAQTFWASPSQEEKMSKRLGGIIGCKYKTSSWYFKGFPGGSNIGSTV